MSCRIIPANPVIILATINLKELVLHTAHEDFFVQAIALAFIAAHWPILTSLNKRNGRENCQSGQKFDNIFRITKHTRILSVHASTQTVPIALNEIQDTT